MRRSVIEWIVLAVSVVAILVVVSILLVEALSESAPPDPTVILHEDRAREGTLGWILPATVGNAGDEAVEDVVLEASATVAGTEESSEVTVAELPIRSSVTIEFGFSARPDGPVTVRLVGQRVP